VFVTGGLNRDALSSAELYDPLTKSWTSVASMNYTRWYSKASVLKNGKVLITGGSNNEILSTVELYDPSTQDWTIIKNMNDARYSHTASVLINGKVLVTGGWNSGMTLDTAEIFSLF
jgi:N-acetylneuraminic acid mutarotase